MSDALPAGWVSAPLDELCRRIRGVSYARDDASAEPKPGSLPILRANNIESDRLQFEDLVYVPTSRISEAQRIRKGDVVIAMSSGSKSVVGKTAQALAEWDGAFGAFCGVLRPSPELNSRYLGLFLRTRDYRRRISDLAAGTNINNLKAEHFSEIEVPLAPLAEQLRIVAKLETLLGKVDACQRRLAKIPRLLKRFRQSVLAAACSGRLTAAWREQASPADLVPPDPANANEAIVAEEIIDAAESWRWLPLQTLCDPSRSICYGVIKLGVEEVDGIHCLRTSDVKPLVIDTTGVKRIARDISDEYRRTLLRGGEVLVNVRGSLGGVAVVPDSLLNWNVSREIAVVPIKGVVSQFIAFWIASLPCQNWLNGVAKGVAYTGINIADLKLLPVALPPLAEQQEIVRRVEQLFAFADQLEARFAKAQAHVDKLTQSLLAKAFRGELVPQDPDDESASALLARICSQTNGAAKPARRKAKAVA